MGLAFNIRTATATDIGTEGATGTGFGNGTDTCINTRTGLHTVIRIDARPRYRYRCEAISFSIGGLLSGAGFAWQSSLRDRELSFWITVRGGGRILAPRERLTEPPGRRTAYRTELVTARFSSPPWSKPNEAPCSLTTYLVTTT